MDLSPWSNYNQQLVNRCPFWQLSIDDNMDAHKDILYQGLTQIVYALDIKLVMPSHYKKPANQSVCTIVAI